MITYTKYLCPFCWIVDVFVTELSLLRDQLEQLTSKADAEAKCNIAVARKQVYDL